MVVASAYGGRSAARNIGDGVRSKRLGLVRRRRILQAIEDRGIRHRAPRSGAVSTMPCGATAKWSRGH